MTTVLPIGYVTVLEAAEMLLPALYAGVPDLPLRKALREEGMDVRDGLAMDRAIDELWKAVDAGTLRPMAIGGRPRRVVRLDAEFTKQVPTLRSPRGRGFAALRQTNPAYHELASWFGPSPYSVSLAFRETEVRKLARKLMRARRIAERGEDQQKPRGRPSQIAIVQSVISDLVGRRKWNPTMGMKALTREVNRMGMKALTRGVNRTAECSPQVSQDTATRALDLLYEQTKDRRFERVRHHRKPRRKRSTK